jgi:FkbH-like protein
MREIVPGESGVVALDLPDETLRAMRAVGEAIAGRTQIVWGEHCSECAFPNCYSACSHYNPRPDLHCRRFENGIEAIDAGVGPPGMRIRFLKWGKLQGEGPADLRPRRSVLIHDAARRVAGEIVDRTPLPYALRHRAGRAWTRAEAFASARAEVQRADAFVVECHSFGAREVPVTLSILPKDRFEVGLFQQRLVLAPGYTRHVVPVSSITQSLDLSRPFLLQIEPLVEAPPETFVFGLVDFVRWAAAPLPSVVPGAPAQAGKKAAAKAKCIVWDLDETVWEGILAEVGAEGVRLRPEVVETIRALDARGILHSIASKNDEKEALAALEHFGIADLFLYPQVGWGPKSASVSSVAKLLDIGIDTFAFVDDQQFERSEVQETLGCVTVFPHTDVQSLLEHPLFDVPVTAESGKRRMMYREEMSRNVAFQTSGASDYDAFLRSCNIKLNLSLLSEDSVTRIYDLSQRTNQVNVTGTRYERRTVEEMARAPGSRLPIVMQCEDRFGDYGAIGFVLFDPQDGLVLDYFMSCRVQRKYVENALFAHLIAIAETRGATRLRCRYKRTERNKLALQLLGDLGFQLHETEPGAGMLERDLAQIRGADIVTVDTRGLP